MKDLVFRSKKGDKDAFLELLQGRTEVLYKIAYSYFKDKDSASDAVQDAVLIAYKNINKLEDGSKFNSWITTILVNRCREIIRKSKKLQVQEYNDAVIDLEKVSTTQYKSQFSKVENRIDVINLLERLDEKYREVIRLKYLGAYTIEEIAEVLDIPQGTVKSRLNFGIKKLRSFMEVKDNAVC
jgi:RNA polymerase sigma-70 factor, ECF subfamily